MGQQILLRQERQQLGRLRRVYVDFMIEQQEAFGKIFHNILRIYNISQWFDA